MNLHHLYGLIILLLNLTILAQKPITPEDKIYTAIDVFVLLGQSKMQAAAYIDIAKIVLPISKTSLVLLHIILFFTHRYFFSDSKQFFFAVMQIGCLTILNMILPLWLWMEINISPAVIQLV